jgi:hypothetical protein
MSDNDRAIEAAAQAVHDLDRLHDPDHPRLAPCSGKPLARHVEIARAAIKAAEPYIHELRRQEQDNPDRYLIWCPDCLTQFFYLTRFHGEIRFQCANCGANFIDDEGFGRP